MRNAKIFIFVSPPAKQILPSSPRQPQPRAVRQVVAVSAGVRHSPLVRAQPGIMGNKVRYRDTIQGGNNIIISAIL